MRQWFEYGARRRETCYERGAHGSRNENPRIDDGSRHQHANRGAEGSEWQHHLADLGRHLRGQRDRPRDRKSFDAAAHDARSDQDAAARPGNRHSQSGGERAEGRHLLCRDLAGQRRRVDQRGFAAQRRAGPGAAPGLPHLRRRVRAEELQALQRRRRQGQQRGTAALAREPGRRGSRPLQDVNPELVEILEKLAAAGIQIVPSEITSHFILERDGFVAFVERREQAFGNVGRPGLMTEQGFAALIWRGDQAFFVGKGFEQPASPEQVQKIRAFAADLTNAL